MGVLLAAIIGLIALIVAPGLFFYFDVTPKIAVLLVGTAAALVWPRGDGRAPRAFSLLCFASVISLGMSTALSTDPALSFFGTNWRRFGMLTQAAVLCFAWLVVRMGAGRPERTRIILRGVVLSGAVTAIYGICQYFGWDPVLPKAAYHIGEGLWTIVRPPGTMGYVSYFATWLLGVVFLSLALVELETTGLLRLAWRLTAALAAIAMLLTGTRAAMLALAAGLAVWMFGRGFRIRKRGFAAAVVLAAVAAAFYFSPAGWALRSRSRWYSEDPWGGARVRLWADSLAMGFHRPLGYGPETFTGAFPRFESAALARAYPDFLHESPHNIFLDAWVSQGIVGVAILAGFCWIGMAGAWRTKRYWIAAAIVGIGVSQMFTVFTMPTALLWFVAVAIGSQETYKPREGEGELLAYRAAGWLAAAFFVYAGVRMSGADRHLASAQDALAGGDIALATREFQGYDALRFPGSGSDLWYSRACANLARSAPNPAIRVQAMLQAGEAGMRATRTSEEPFNAWYNLSSIYAGQNDFANTEKCLREAIGSRPNWFKPHWTLAQVLRLEGRLAEAEREAVTAADLDGGKHQEVARTLEEIRRKRAPQHEQP